MAPASDKRSVGVWEAIGVDCALPGPWTGLGVDGGLTESGSTGAGASSPGSGSGIDSGLSPPLSAGIGTTSLSPGTETKESATSAARSSGGLVGDGCPGILTLRNWTETLSRRLAPTCTS